MSIKNIGLLLATLLFTLALIFYLNFTIFVVQPIGAIPDGVTMIISRNTNIEFIDSADAVCRRSQNGVSLLCRAMVLGKVAQESKIYARLPYSEWLYLASNDSKSY